MPDPRAWARRLISRRPPKFWPPVEPTNRSGGMGAFSTTFPNFRWYPHGRGSNRQARKHRNTPKTFLSLSLDLTFAVPSTTPSSSALPSLPVKHQVLRMASCEPSHLSISHRHASCSPAHLLRRHSQASSADLDSSVSAALTCSRVAGLRFDGHINPDIKSRIWALNILKTPSAPFSSLIRPEKTHRKGRPKPVSHGVPLLCTVDAPRVHTIGGFYLSVWRLRRSQRCSIALRLLTKCFSFGPFSHVTNLSTLKFLEP